jgi:hypothetical protein
MLPAATTSRDIPFSNSSFSRENNMGRSNMPEGMIRAEQGDVGGLVGLTQQHIRHVVRLHVKRC